MKQETEFISVEISIKTNHDTNLFVKWFEEKDNYVEKLSWESHKWFIYFAPLSGNTPDCSIQNLCKSINELPDQIKEEWFKADIREFNIGYQLGEDSQCFQQNLSSETISMVNDLKAGIVISLYPKPNT